MKKRGISLIEVIVSIFLISILAVSVSGIIAISYKNINANGRSINNINAAKTQLDIAMFEEINEPPPGVVNAIDERTYADLGGAMVKTRYITSTIFDATGQDTSGIPNSEFLYVFDYTLTEGLTEPKNVPDVYLDYNKNGLFDEGKDQAVPLENFGHKEKALEKLYNVPSNANLVFNGDVYIESNYSQYEDNYNDVGVYNIVRNCLLILTINAPNSDVIFKDGSKFVCNGGVQIYAKNITATNSQISSPRFWTYGNMSNFVGYTGLGYSVINKAPNIYGSSSYVSICFYASNDIILDNSKISAPILILAGLNNIKAINGSDLVSTGWDGFSGFMYIDSKNVLLSGNRNNPTTLTIPLDSYNIRYVSINAFIGYLDSSSERTYIQLGDKSRGGSYETNSYVKFIRGNSDLNTWNAYIPRSAYISFKTDVGQGISPVYYDFQKNYFR